MSHSESTFFVTSRDDLRQAITTALRAVLPRLLSRLQSADGPPKEWLSNREAMEFLDLSKSTLQRYRDDGTLPYSKVGGNVYYKRADILRVLEEHATGGASGTPADRSALKNSA